MSAYRKTVLILPAPRPGADHRVTLFLPEGPAPLGGFPSLWMLDGNAAAQDLEAAMQAPGAARAPGPAPVLICLGHDTQARFAALERARDYTPEGAGEVQDPRGRPAGGAPAFLKRLTERLIPAVEAQFPADPAARTLWGHSYGGLFVLRTAMLGASPFAGYIAASPALWWDHARYLQDLKRRLAAGERPNAPLCFHTGGAERERASQPSAPDAQALLQMRAALPPDALAGLVTAFGAASAGLTTFPGLSHGETFTHSACLSAGLAG